MFSCWRDLLKSLFFGMGGGYSEEYFRVKTAQQTVKLTPANVLLAPSSFIAEFSFQHIGQSIF